MTSQTTGGSGDKGDDERLRALFEDAVSDVEPHDRLADVRRRTRARRTGSSRRWAPILAGAGAVAATVVVASLVVSGLRDDTPRGSDAPVASSPTGTTTAAPTTAAAALYYVGESPTGPRLYREFQVVGLTPDPEQRVLLALQRLGEDAGPHDPDYRTVWPADAFQGVRVEDDAIVVELGPAALAPVGPSASIGLQQAVYTAEAAVGETLPLAFERGGEQVRRVLGFRYGPRVVRDRSYSLTAPVNITDPAERLAVEDGVLSANGTMSPNAQSGVRWSLLRGGAVVLEGRAAPIDITGPDARATLHAPGWETGAIDVGALPPGDYTFEVTVREAGQTSDRPALFRDTRTITLR